MRRVVSLNGELTSPDRALVSVFDRGFLYGDSVFEVVRTYRGELSFLPEHVARLARGCAALEIEMGVGEPALRAEIARTAEALMLGDGEEALVRVIVTRGEGTGLEPPPNAHALRVVTAEPLTLDEATLVRGIKGVLLAHAPLAVPGLKTGSYVASVLARQRARACGAAEAIFVDGAGALIEGASANVFVRFGDRLLTAPDSAGVLAGITRAHVLELAARTGLRVELVAPRLADLGAADEVFVTSSVRGVVPIAELTTGQEPAFLGQDLSGALALRQAFLARALAIAETLKSGRETCDNTAH
jgi:branched-chain amino acid aminotransferase